MTAVQAVLLVMVGVAGTLVALTRDPVRQAILAGSFGLILALLFFALQAPDVALSQLVVAESRCRRWCCSRWPRCARTRTRTTSDAQRAARRLRSERARARGAACVVVCRVAGLRRLRGALRADRRPDRRAGSSGDEHCDVHGVRRARGR